MKLYVYKKEEINLQNKFKILVPFLYGTELEQSLKVKIAKKDRRFYGSTGDWKSEWRIWKDYKYGGEFEFVNSQAGADYILYPYTLDEVEQTMGDDGARKFIRSLPYFKEYEDKHIFLSLRGKPVIYGTSAIILRCGVDTNNKDINSYAWPYPIEDYPEYLSYDIKELKYGTNFIGCNKSHSCRTEALESIQNKLKLASYIDVIDDFFGNWVNGDVALWKERHDMFMEKIKESFTTLCPRGWGVNSIRFFETLMLGRIPILISDGCELPFSWMIDYNKFVIQQGTVNAKHIADIILDSLDKYEPDAIVLQYHMARESFETLQCKNWNKLLIQLLERNVKLDKSFGRYMDVDDILRSIKSAENNMVKVNEIPGYLFPGDMHMIYDCAKASDGPIVEVGSLFGLSTFIMSKATDNRITAVDIWEPYNDMEITLEKFKDNMVNGNCPKVIPFKCNSVDASKTFENNSLSLIYIDGDHSYQGCIDDLHVWWDKLKPGGVMIGHDGVPGSEVEKALKQFKEDIGIEYTQYNNYKGHPAYHMWRIDKCR